MKAADRAVPSNRYCTVLGQKPFDAQTFESQHQDDLQAFECMGLGLTDANSARIQLLIFWN